MAWDVDLVIMLRSEIGDLDGSAYSDERLRQVLTYAAYSVSQRAKFANSYTISIEEMTISPDPYTSGDYDFSVLMVYKAACTILTGEARSKGALAVRIKDDTSSFDNVDSAKNIYQLMKDICATYENLLLTYQLVGSAQNDSNGGPGQSVLSPYSPGSFLHSWNGSSHRNGGFVW